MFQICDVVQWGLANIPANDNSFYFRGVVNIF